MASSDDFARLQSHLELLRAEHRKLQAKCSDLERALEKAGGTTSSSSSGPTFVGNLLKTISGLFNKDVYSDIKILVEGRTLFAHKLVLSVQGQWASEPLETINEISLDSMSYNATYTLLKWLYTNVLDDSNDISFLIDLLRSSHRLKLDQLKKRLEASVVSLITTANSILVLCVAHEIHAADLKKYTSQIVIEHWAQYKDSELKSLEAPLFYELAKQKTQHPLHCAITHAREDVVFLFFIEFDLNLRSRINELDDGGRTPLHLALLSNQESIAKNLVQQGANVNYSHSETAYSLLHEFIYAKNEFAAAFLINNNANINAVARDGKTPLHVAVENNLRTTVELLLKRSCSINVQDREGNTALHAAILHAHSDMISLLLTQSGLDVNSRNGLGHTALWLSLALPDKSFAKTLLGRGCDINLCTPSGDTMLHYAIMMRNEQAALFLIEHGITVDLSNHEGETPLHLASREGLVTVVSKLLDAGANPNALTFAVRSPLMLAIENSRQTVVLRLLSEQALNLNTSDKAGQTALGLALEANQTDIASRLVARGADIEAANPTGLTLLHLAIMRSDLNSVKFLLENKARFTTLTADARTPLQLAIIHASPSIVDALCAAGADPNGCSELKDSPLRLALNSKLEQVAQVLVKYNCDINIHDPAEGGFTPLHIAVKNQDLFAARFLIDNGANVNDQENSQRKSVLHLVAEIGLTSLIQDMFLAAGKQYGLDVNPMDAEQRTPIHAAIIEKHREVALILLQHPDIQLLTRDAHDLSPFDCALANKDQDIAQAIVHRVPEIVEDSNAKGLTALHTAINQSDEDTVNFLLSLRVNVNVRVKDSANRTALSLSVERGLETITQALLKHGADTSMADEDSKWTVAHVAASLGYTKILGLLIQYGANMNATNDVGDTVLHSAVRAGQLNVVAMLLSETDAKPDAVNASGRTPLHTLALYPKENAVNILQLLFKATSGGVNPQDAEGNTPLYYAYQNGAGMLSKALVLNGGHLAIPNYHGGTCFDLQTPSRKLLQQLLAVINKEQSWIDLPTCQVCQQKFGVTTRKHHCRHCGRVLCSKDSSKQVCIPKFNIGKPVRVCDDCFDVLSVLVPNP